MGDEQEKLLPIANVGRIMKQILPEKAKISKEAKERMQESASEFISFVTCEASDKCHKENRKTVNGDDIVWALSSLGLDNYAEAMTRYMFFPTLHPNEVPIEVIVEGQVKEPGTVLEQNQVEFEVKIPAEICVTNEAQVDVPIENPVEVLVTNAATEIEEEPATIPSDVERIGAIVKDQVKAEEPAIAMNPVEVEEPATATDLVEVEMIDEEHLKDFEESNEEEAIKNSTKRRRIIMSESSDSSATDHDGDEEMIVPTEEEGMQTEHTVKVDKIDDNVEKLLDYAKKGEESNHSALRSSIIVESNVGRGREKEKEVLNF
nr:nuclear transcription factor Y subunit B-4-like [Ipomoea batatas]